MYSIRSPTLNKESILDGGGGESTSNGAVKKQGELLYYRGT